MLTSDKVHDVSRTHMNNDYPLRCWSMEQVAVRGSFAFHVLDVALRICLLLAFLFFNTTLNTEKLVSDKRIQKSVSRYTVA